MQETWVWSLGWKDPLEDGIATHSSIHAWRISMDRGAWCAAVHGVAKSQPHRQIARASLVSQQERICLQCRRRRRCRFSPWVGKIPWRNAWQHTPVFLLDNSMEGGAWRATVYGVAKSQTWLNTHCKFISWFIVLIIKPNNISDSTEQRTIIPI